MTASYSLIGSLPQTRPDLPSCIHSRQPRRTRGVPVVNCVTDSLVQPCGETATICDERDGFSARSSAKYGDPRGLEGAEFRSGSITY